jgi:glycosyltransferase involved in cell wall biosynthesis
MLIYASIIRLKTKFIFEVHTLHTDLLFRVAVRLSDAVVTTSEAARRDVHSLVPTSPARFLVARNAVDLSRFVHLANKIEARRMLQLPPDAHMVAYVGSFGRYLSWKGTDTFLDAARHVPECIFLAVGARPDEIDTFSKRYQASNVRIRAAVQPHDVPQILVAADALVLPNKKGEIESTLYTSPLKLFEYMASGAPIIASNLPSIREIISEKDAFFFDANDIASLVDAIRAVLSNPGEANRRALHAKETVTKYTWAARARAITDFILSI